MKGTRTSVRELVPPDWGTSLCWHASIAVRVADGGLTLSRKARNVAPCHHNQQTRRNTMPTTTRRAAAKPAPEPEVVEDEFEDLEDEEPDTDEAEDDAPEELEDEVEDDELEEVDETPAPKKKKAASTAIDVPEFGSAWLAEHITNTLNEKMDGRAVRMLPRKLAADGKLNGKVGER